VSLGPTTPTDEQMYVIEAPATARIVVLAPAGTGKTEVVSKRLAHFVETEDLVPGSDLIVLSFSRNAVGEIKRRIRTGDPRIAAIHVATFDSYATRLLATHANPGDWEDGDYDDRIRGARRLLLEHDDARSDLARYRHVVVDEIQDLVGERAELVDAILCALTPSAGFTLLGDPAQGIYDFQLKSGGSSVTGRQFLRRVLDRAPEPEVRELTTDFRSQAKFSTSAAARGRSIREQALDYQTSSETDGGIGTGLYELPSYDLTWACRVLSRASRDGQTGAVLCKTNGQALLVSRALHDADVPHLLRPGAGDRPIVSWLASAFRGYQYPTMSRGALEERLARSDARPDIDTAWRALKRAEGRGSPTLSTRILASRVQTGVIPEELVENPDCPVSVSSIHRAKGLEWDVVCLCGLERVGDDAFDYARLTYVAMTRAREELSRIRSVDDKGLHRSQGVGRWFRREHPRARASQIELLAGDIETVGPGGAMFFEGDANAIQEYLAARVEPGDPLKLVLIRSIVEGQPRAIYRVDHKGNPIGVTSERLSEALKEGVDRGRPFEFPSRIIQGRVQAVETVVGSSAAGSRAGLGSSGFWLRPRIGGLADLQWGDK
jgi:superfamily I DNA/RNA helicase